MQSDVYKYLKNSTAALKQLSKSAQLDKSSMRKAKKQN